MPKETARPQREDTLLIVIAILLALILLIGTGLGFYFMGVSRGGQTGIAANTNALANNTVTQTTPAQTNSGGVSVGTDATSTGSSDSSSQIGSLLNGLKDSSGGFDTSKVESTLSGLIGQSKSQVSTTLTLVSLDQVKKNGQSGKEAVATYLTAVQAIVGNNLAGNLDESAISQIFGGNTSLLEKEVQKDQGILSQLRQLGTPNEAIDLQQKYLTVYTYAITVVQAEITMLASGSIDYAVLGQAQGIISLSKEIDQKVFALKSQFDL